MAFGGPARTLPELCRDGVANFVIDLFEYFSVDLADPAQSSACHQVAIAVEILRLREIGKDIILFINEG